ncbi:MAG: histidine phosphatase family protein [Verrucomicrobia bacterium]|nr:histidine phosphatase family protein [Verrucomicrobiota bacterium]MCH8527848.1 histidine phosphatase family protein [Kiritimatiellia bacterium]
MKLILIRHGQSYGNIYTDEDLPDARLTGLGLQQATRVAKRLADSEIETIVASPLLRALATAQPLAQALSLPIQVWHEAVEIRREGPYRGPGLQDLQEEFPEAKFGCEHTDDGWHYPGDDNVTRGIGRAKQTLDRLLGEFSNSTVALIAHGNFNRFLLLVALGLSHTRHIHFPQDNGCINVLEFAGKAIRVSCLNDTCHQAGVESL